MISGETDLARLIQHMTPEVQSGAYVFVSVKKIETIPKHQIIGQFREKEGITLILERKNADTLDLKYDFIASWITLTIHSSLEAVGLTAVFSTALAKHAISCNVIAGYYHDHIFVAKKDEEKAMKVLNALK